MDGLIRFLIICIVFIRGIYMYSQKDLRSRSLEVLLPALLENYDSPIDKKKKQPTDMNDYKEVRLPIKSI